MKLSITKNRWSFDPWLNQPVKFCLHSCHRSAITAFAQRTEKTHRGTDVWMKIKKCLMNLKIVFWILNLFNASKNICWIKKKTKKFVFYDWVCLKALQQNAYEKIFHNLSLPLFCLFPVKSISHHFCFIVIRREIFRFLAKVQNVEINSFHLFQTLFLYNIKLNNFEITCIKFSKIFLFFFYCPPNNTKQTDNKYFKNW